MMAPPPIADGSYIVVASYPGLGVRVQWPDNMPVPEVARVLEAALQNVRAAVRTQASGLALASAPLDLDHNSIGQYQP